MVAVVVVVIVIVACIIDASFSLDADSGTDLFTAVDQPEWKNEDHSGCNHVIKQHDATDRRRTQEENETNSIFTTTFKHFKTCKCNGAREKDCEKLLPH